VPVGRQSQKSEYELTEETGYSAVEQETRKEEDAQRREIQKST
jgi:hypothetical protein